MNIAEFLEARIAEDEEAARGWVEPKSGDRELMTAVTAVMARVLKECAAKRKIIARYRYWDEGGPDAGVSIEDLGYVPSYREYDEMEEVLRALVTVYAEHPDYNQGWGL